MVIRVNSITQSWCISADEFSVWAGSFPSSEIGVFADAVWAFNGVPHPV